MHRLTAIRAAVSFFSNRLRSFISEIFYLLRRSELTNIKRRNPQLFVAVIKHSVMFQ